MKLDRNITNPKRDKYALIKLREWPHGWSPNCQSAYEVLVKSAAIDFGDTENADFFVIRLKDKYAADALHAYANAADLDDPEYGSDVRELALLAQNHPNKRKPD